MDIQAYSVPSAMNVLMINALSEEHCPSCCIHRRAYNSGPHRCDACRFSLDELRYEYPEEIYPDGQTPQAFLESEVWAGAARRYPSGVPDSVRATLERELARELASAKGGGPGVREIRGQGLMLGIELDRPCGAIWTRAAEAGLLLSVTADSVIRLVPPLIMTEAEADEVVAILVPLIKTFLAEAP